MDITCVKLRVFSGTEVIVFWSTEVPLEDDVMLSWHLHVTSPVDSPASRAASRTGASETFTTTDGIREVLNPGLANLTS